MSNTKSTNGTNKKKPPVQNKKRAVDEKVSNGMPGSQKVAIVMFASSVMLICIAIIEGQSVWTFLHNSFLGLFGYCAYLWPAMLFYISFVFALKKPAGGIKAILIGTSVFIVLIGALIHLFANQEIILGESSIGIQISAAWNERVATPNGGVLGALVGGFVAKIFGIVPAQVTLIIVTIVVLMFVTKTTLTTLFSVLAKPVKKVGEISAAKKEKVLPPCDEARMPAKPFNPPVVLGDEDLLVQTLSSHGLTNQTVPAAASKPQSKKTVADSAYDDVEICIANFKNNKTDSPSTTNDTQVAISTTIQQKNDQNKGKKSDSSDNDSQTDSYRTYRLPPTDCLSPVPAQNTSGSEEELRINGQKLIETLKSFGIQAKILMISRGPSVTRYELQPSPGIRISRITKLADDIALNLAAASVRIEAPIPNKAAIGVEIPNRIRTNVSFREIVETEQFRTSKSKLNIALGKDITGNVICADLDKMPHLLIAGTTGSGKSVCMNSLIVSILFNATPDEVKLLLIDAKRGVELGPYNGIAHLAIPVVEDPRKAAGALSWAVTEVENRYKMFNEKKVRDIAAFNELAEKNEDMKKLHRIVIFIDELNDLMIVAPNEVEEYICRIAQMARAAGIHLVIATQRPSVDVITGVIKANIPSRIALSVASYVDSRTIIDTNGAEKLLGNGDMLFNPVGTAKPIRVQGCFISNKEIEKTVKYIKSEAQACYDEEIINDIASRAVEVKKKGAVNGIGEEGEHEDEMLQKAIEVVAESQIASTTFLQRKLKLGYARAANIVDTLEQRHIVGPPDGSKPRKVLITKQQWLEMYALSQDTANTPDE